MGLDIMTLALAKSYSNSNNSETDDSVDLANLYEIINEIESSYSSMSEAFSTNGLDEWWTGHYWRDGSGRKAYRKWITGTLANNKNKHTFPLGIDELDEIFVVSADLQQSSGTTLQLGFLPNTPSNCVVLDVNKTEVGVSPNGVARPGTVWVLVEYCCLDR